MYRAPSATVSTAVTATQPAVFRTNQGCPPPTYSTRRLILPAAVPRVRVQAVRDLGQADGPADCQQCHGRTDQDPALPGPSPRFPGAIRRISGAFAARSRA